MEKEILHKELWDYFNPENNKTKIGNKIYNWLNQDNLWGIMAFESGQFYFQLTNSYVKMPNYIYDYLKRWVEKRGFTYLYN